LLIKTHSNVLTISIKSLLEHGEEKKLSKESHRILSEQPKQLNILLLTENSVLLVISELNVLCKKSLTL